MSATIHNQIATTSYFSNVSAAARQLFSALFAVKPMTSEHQVAQCNNESIWWLNQLATDCERHSPNLSAELRSFTFRL